ncbi:MAG: xanthine dehydrogenase family protein subunit M [Spirochaetales bacterium]|jgi:aerobic carbon-monoxide dehydrogenase medium subunit|nr:xanthine dehydrogenase family protein subunit M [Spirochaetales bacterium]
MNYQTPETLEEVYDLLESNKDAVILAGGTDLAVVMSEAADRPDTIIDITCIAELKGISEKDNGIVIGAATTIADIQVSEKVPAALSAGAAAIGSPQIRNVATIGGNICNASPCGDTLSPLVAMSAVFVLGSAKGERELTAEDFFKGPKNTALEPGEILIRILIEGRYLKGSSAFSMYGKRNGQAISQVNGAVWLQLSDGIVDDIRMGFGSVAPVPIRARKTEDSLRGSKLDMAAIEALRTDVRSEVVPITDVRASEDYRYELTEAIYYDIMCDAAGFPGGKK